MIKKKQLVQLGAAPVEKQKENVEKKDQPTMTYNNSMLELLNANPDNRTDNLTVEELDSRGNKTIPIQLNSEVFIVLTTPTKTLLNTTSERLKLKMPAEKWRENQYTYKKMQYIRSRSGRYPGCNYGVVNTTLTVVEIDAPKNDDTNKQHIESVQKRALSQLPATYAVRSDRGMHLYYHCSDAPDKTKIVESNTEANASIRTPGHQSYLVGPYSTHPTGREYQPVDENQGIADITWHELTEALGWKKNAPNHAEREQAILQQSGEKRAAAVLQEPDPAKVGYKTQYHCNVFDWLQPREIDGGGYYYNGVWVNGAHPVHGAETGWNFGVSVDGTGWKCFHCDSWGGLFEAVAVAEGIIDCKDCHGYGSLNEKQLKKVYKILDDKYPDAAEKRLQEYRNKQREEARKRLERMMKDVGL